MSEATLKPCPFCGGEALTVFDNGVACSSPRCGATGPDLGHCIGAKCRSDSIAAWNTRADAAKIAKLQDRNAALVEAAAWAFRNVKHMPMDEASQADFARHLATIAAMKGVSHE